MDKLKRDEEWSRALRDLAEQRDRLLRGAPEIPPARRAILGAALLREFPVEAALRVVRVRRDRLFSEPPPEIPRAVARELRRGLTNAQRTQGETWPQLFFARAALLAACLLAALGVIFLGKREPFSAGQHHVPPPRIPTELRMAVAGDQFSLRMNATELASLRSTFFASNAGSLEDSAEASARLRLDLPVRAFLRDESIASTP